MNHSELLNMDHLLLDTRVAISLAHQSVLDVLVKLHLECFSVIHVHWRLREADLSRSGEGGVDIEVLHEQGGVVVLLVDAGHQQLSLLVNVVDSSVMRRGELTPQLSTQQSHYIGVGVVTHLVMTSEQYSSLVIKICLGAGKTAEEVLLTESVDDEDDHTVVSVGGEGGVEFWRIQPENKI